MRVQVGGESRIVKIVEEYVVARSVWIVGREERIVEPFVCRERRRINGRSGRCKHGKKREIQTSRRLSHSKNNTIGTRKLCFIYGPRQMQLYSTEKDMVV